MTTTWDAKHDPESLVDYGQHPHHDTQPTAHPEDTSTTYNDPYAPIYERQSYYNADDRMSKHLRSNSSPEHEHEHAQPDVRDSYPGQRASQAEDFSSRGSLVKNAAEFSRAELYSNYNKPPMEQMEYQEPQQRQGSFFSRLTDTGGKYPLEQRIENKKRGVGRQRYPFISWALTVAMVAIMIYELVRNDQEQGSPISTKPVFNPLIGPSQSAMINFGARYPPCMKEISSLPSNLQFGCLNNTANPPTSLCSLEDICGFGGFHGKPPNQWFRFITPIFIHAGIIHIILNMLAQLTVSAQIEKEMGSGGFIILYFAAGIFGNVLGGNFALLGLPSVGASGAIFGTVAATWVDLLTHWRYKFHPVRQLVILIIELIVGIGLGYIPGVDNFAHLGGFFMGLLVSATLYPVVSPSRRHKAIVWGIRLAAIPVAVVLMIVLIRNFYTGDPYAACSGCRYLSCFPTAANNHCQGNGISITSSGGSSL